MIRREIRVFLTAVMFLTRLPVPRWTDHDPGYLRQAPRYFPWVGLIVGLIAAGVFETVRQVFPTNIALVASMAAGILATGAFHEDGFADVCDGFGGGWTKEKILAIMKDSRLGTFGVIGLGAMLGLKFLVLEALVGDPAPVRMTDGAFAPAMHLQGGGTAAARLTGLLLLAHAASRLYAVAVMQAFPYAGDPGISKSKDVAGRMQPAAFVVALGALVVPALLLPPVYLWSLVPPVLVTWGLARYFARWIGGYTGDCLGAIQQVTELTIYFGIYLIVHR